MKSKLKYNKKAMGKVNDTLNKIKKTKKPQHCIITIYNIDNNYALQVGGVLFIEIAYIHFFITLGLEEFPVFITLGLEEFPGLNSIVDKKQEYELRLDSQQLERIFLNYNEMTNLNPKSMEDLSLLNAVEPLLNALKDLLEDEE
jgi:hypothetical protein